MLRSNGLARGETAAGLLSRPSSTQKTDCDFDPEAWDRGAQETLAACGIGRVVMSRLPAADMSPSPLAGSANQAWRAVIELPQSTDRSSLAALHARGARGIRFTLGGAGGDSLDPVLRAADCIVPFGWHVEINVAQPGAVRALARAEWQLMQFPLAVCFSGVGSFGQGPLTDSTDLDFVLGMMHLGRYWLKFSGDDLAGPQIKLWDEPQPLAQALQTVRKDRLIWGSGKQPAGGCATHLASGLALLEKCLPHPADQEQVLVDNPATLYGFGSR